MHLHKCRNIPVKFLQNILTKRYILTIYLWLYSCFSFMQVIIYDHLKMKFLHRVCYLLYQDTSEWIIEDIYIYNTRWPLTTVEQKVLIYLLKFVCGRFNLRFGELSCNYSSVMIHVKLANLQSCRFAAQFCSLQTLINYFYNY